MKTFKRLMLAGYVFVALFCFVVMPIVQTANLPDQIILSQNEYINGVQFNSPFVKYSNNYTQDVGLDAQEKFVDAKLFGIFKVARKPVKLLPSEEFLAGGFAIGFEAETKEFTVKTKLGKYKKHSTSGIGTLTYVNPQNNNFAALGHDVTDFDSGEYVEIIGGKVYECDVMSVKKSKDGSVGQFNACLDTTASEGSLNGSGLAGIYGCLHAGSKILEKCNAKYPVGSRYSIKPGKAKLLTSIDGKTPVEYDIQIVKVNSQKQIGSKSFLIRITDKRLLENTGGIVHGMSGSPIIQNGKIVGSLTHVLLKNTSMGYGIYIDWMVAN